MPLKNENKSNAVYNDFKVVWNSPTKEKIKTKTKEAKPLLDGKKEDSSEEKAGFKYWFKVNSLKEASTFCPTSEIELHEFRLTDWTRIILKPVERNPC